MVTSCSCATSTLWLERNSRSLTAFQIKIHRLRMVYLSLSLLFSFDAVCCLLIVAFNLFLFISLRCYSEETIALCERSWVKMLPLPKQSWDLVSRLVRVCHFVNDAIVSRTHVGTIDNLFLSPTSWYRSLLLLPRITKFLGSFFIQEIPLALRKYFV